MLAWQQLSSFKNIPNSLNMSGVTFWYYVYLRAHYCSVGTRIFNANGFWLSCRVANKTHLVYYFSWMYNAIEYLLPFNKHVNKVINFLVIWGMSYWILHWMNWLLKKKSRLFLLFCATDINKKTQLHAIRSRQKCVADNLAGNWKQDEFWLALLKSILNRCFMGKMF